MVIVSGCGSVGATSSSPLHSLSRTDILSADGLDVAVVPRPTGDFVWISVWIGAGSIEADPPALATLAAWSSIPSDSEIEARVLPDATEFGLSCRTSELDACLVRLANVLREPVSLETYQTAYERLLASRRGASSDPSRTSDRLAIEALFGLNAGKLDPFGGDLQQLSRGEVARYRERGWRNAPTLWIVVGDTDANRVRRALRDAQPPASGAHGRPTLRARTGTLADEAETQSVSVAIEVSNDREASGVAAIVAEELTDAQTYFFHLAGHAILLVRASDRDALIGALEYARAVYVPRAPFARAREPRDLAAQLGSEWIGALGARREAERNAMGIGYVGNAVDRTSHQSAEREVDAVRVVAGEYGHATVALAFAFAATEEPARTHGMRAVLIRAVERCVTDAQLPVSSWVDETTLGIVVESSSRDPSLALRAIGTCGRHLHLRGGALEQFRSESIARLGPHERQLALVARAAAPRTPSLLAPFGTIRGIAAIRPDDILDTWSRVATRERVRIIVVGAEDATDAARRANAIHRRFPEGTLTHPATSESSGESVLRVEGPEAVYLVMRDPTPRDRDAQVGAEAARDALIASASEGGVDAVWSAAGGGSGGSWLALGLRVPDDELADIAPRLEGLREHAQDELTTQLENRADAEDARLAWSRADVAALAHRLATDDAREEVDRRAAHAAASALLNSTPIYVIARPL